MIFKQLAQTIYPVYATDFQVRTGSPALSAGSALTMPYWTFANAATSIVAAMVWVPPGWKTAKVVGMWGNLSAAAGNVSAIQRTYPAVSVGDNLSTITITDHSATFAADGQSLYHEVVAVASLAVDPSAPMPLSFGRGTSGDTLAGNVGFMGAYLERLS